MIRQLLDHRGGGVSILGAFSLFALIGAMGFGVDATAAYTAQIRNQRVADMAALAAAQVMMATGSDSEMDAAALATALAGGLPDPEVDASLGDSPDGEGEAVTVVITTPEQLFFARILGMGDTLDVRAESVARLGASGTPPCIIALASGGNGITLSGAAQVNATECSVAANARMTASGSSRMTAETISTPGGVQTSGTAAFVTTPTPNQIGNAGVTDPLASHAALLTAFDRLDDAVTVPTVDLGANFEPPWYPDSYSHSGKASTFIASPRTFKFPAGDYRIRNLTVPGSMHVILTGSPNSNITISGNINIGGSASLTIGDGNVTVIGTVTVGGSGRLTMGNGTHYMGPVSVSGSSRFEVGNGAFTVNGNFNSTGGSTVIIGAASNHIINGNLAINGALTMGAGTYLIDGSFSSSGSSSVVGTGVNIVMTGGVSLSGASTANLSAGTGSSTNLSSILFASLTSQAISFSGSGSAIYSGAFYFPNSSVSVSGAARLGGGGSCFMLIASRLAISGSGSNATSCPDIESSGSAGTSVALVR